MLLASVNSEEDNERIKKIPEFLDVCKNYENVKDKEQNLLNWGYRQFTPKKKEFEIDHCNMTTLKKGSDDNTDTLNKWKKEIQYIYDKNYKMAHLQGTKISEFYKFIQEKNKK